MDRADVIILGGGLIGLTLAVASASWRMLEAIGIAERLDGEGCPILSIRVSDGLRPGGIVFDAPEADDPLGIMVENRRLRQVLREAAGDSERVQLPMPA